MNTILEWIIETKLSVIESKNINTLVDEEDMSFFSTAWVLYHTLVLFKRKKHHFFTKLPVNLRRRCISSTSILTPTQNGNSSKLNEIYFGRSRHICFTVEM